MRPHILLSAAVGLGLVSACGGSGGTGPGGSSADLLAALVGTWNATAAIWTKLPDGTPTIDLISQMGGSLTLTVTSDSRYTSQIVVPGQSTQTFTGRLTVEAGLITIVDDSDPQPQEFSYTLLNGELDMATNDDSFDFDDDGVDEPASLSLSFQRAG